MPANLSPEFERAERRYRSAPDDAERLAALQEMLATIPKHKGTEKMQADIKHRLSQLRREQHQCGHAAGPDPFHIPKSGAGQVVLIGPPNTGKSSLLAAATKAPAKVADYPFTTVVPQPGMWERDGVAIELVDTPALTPEHVPTGLLGTIRNADVVGVVVETGDAALEQAESVLATLRERDVTLRTCRIGSPHAGAPHALPALIVLNKVDLPAAETEQALRDLYRDTLEVWPVSARLGQGLSEWFDRLWYLLDRIRVFAKQPGRPPDLGRPFVLRRGATVADLAALIHRDLPASMNHARLWGHSRFAGQHVHKTEPLEDHDIVEIHE